MLLSCNLDSTESFDIKSHVMKNSNTSVTLRSVNVRVFANGVAVATIKMLQQAVAAERPVHSA